VSWKGLERTSLWYVKLNLQIFGGGAYNMNPSLGVHISPNPLFDSLRKGRVPDHIFCVPTCTVQ
jgi:hypothetical protein